MYDAGRYGRFFQLHTYYIIAIENKNLIGKWLPIKNTQQISEVYGKRIGDRLKETTEIVPFLNGSYRG